MKKGIYIFGLVIAMTGAASPAKAQFFVGGYGWPWGGWYDPWYSAAMFTNSLGNLAAGAGQFNLGTSMAAKNYQDAYRQWIENEPRRVAAYFELRRMNDSYRASRRRSTPTPEEIEFYNRQRTPQRLSYEQLDERSGRLHWPAVLMGYEFGPQRLALAYLFAARSDHPSAAGLGTPNYHEALEQIAEMQSTLKAEIDEIRPDEFIAGQKFLKSLAHEARFVPGADTRQARVADATRLHSVSLER
jgi:hypothetical protein